MRARFVCPEERHACSVGRPARTRRLRVERHRRRRVRLASAPVQQGDASDRDPQAPPARSAERATGAHRRHPGAVRPRGDLVPRRLWRCRRRHRPQLARGSQTGDRVGRSCACPRDPYGLCRTHGVEAAGDLQSARRLPHHRRARGGDPALRPRRDAQRGVRQRTDRGPRRAAVRAMELTRARTLAPAVRRPTVRRRYPAARQPRMSGVLHLLSPSHSCGLPRPLGRQHRRRARTAVRHVQAALHHLPRPALQRRSRSGARARGGDPHSRARPAVRVRNADRPARSRAVR